MNRINSSSLFHFTRSMDTLTKIIVNGLRYSFAYEQYSKEIIRAYEFPLYTKNSRLQFTVGNGVAIPMISFCDIPITRTEQHIKKYGSYMIGLNKTNFSKEFKNTINPVIYVHSPNLKNAITMVGLEYSRAYCDIFEMFKNQNIQNKFANRNCSNLSNSKKTKHVIDPYIKTRFLSNFLIGLVKPIKDRNHYYYDEREWRLFLPENANNINWIWGITKKEYQQNKNDWNDELNQYSNMFIKIPIEYYDP